MTPDEYIQRLTETSKKKHQLIREIILLTKEQSNVITEDSIPELEKLIVEKQVKIDSIDKLDEEFNVYFQRLKQILKVSSLYELNNHNLKGVKDLQDAIGNIMSCTKEITEIESRNSEKAKKVRDDLGNAIKKINQGKKLNSGYISDKVIQPPSYFIDKKK